MLFRSNQVARRLAWWSIGRGRWTRSGFENVGGNQMIYELFNPQQAKILMDRIWPEVKAHLMAGHKMRLEIKKATRSGDQNSMFHTLIHQIYLEMKIVGSTWSSEDWKRLLIDQWAHETGRKFGKVVPSLDGERVVQLGWQSRDFSTEDASEFIEWLYAWSAEKGLEI